jgi:hypothetical protein
MHLRSCHVIVEIIPASNHFFRKPLARKHLDTLSLCPAVHGRAVYHAFLDPRFGPHEAVWEQAGLVLMLLVKPMIWTDTDWFLGFMDRLLAG